MSKDENAEEDNDYIKTVEQEKLVYDVINNRSNLEFNRSKIQFMAKDENTEEDNDYIKTVEQEKLVYDIINNRCNLEFDRSKILDGKASGIISFVGIILALQGGIGALLIKDVPKIGTLYIVMNEIFILSVFCLTFSILSGLFAYRVKSWFFFPEVNDFIEACKNEDINQLDILRDMEKAMASSIDKSKSNNDKKSKFIVYGFFSLVVGLVLNLFFIIGLIIMMNY
jgi:hypothetical protein